MNEKKKLPIMSRLGVIFLTYRRYMEKTAKNNKLTLNQYYILKQLVKKEYLNPSEIADMLFCDRPTATVIIDNLKKYGYITKERDSENGKYIQVKITELGLAQVKEAAASFAKLADFDPLSCFTEDEKNTFEDLLIKLHNNIKKIG
jgi:DNA-binding MarR family transcriptional regulator